MRDVFDVSLLIYSFFLSLTMCSLISQYSIGMGTLRMTTQLRTVTGTCDKWEYSLMQLKMYLGNKERVELKDTKCEN